METNEQSPHIIDLSAATDAPRPAGFGRHDGETRSQARARIERRRAEVARMTFRQNTQQEIAAELGVNQSTISRDLTELKALWREAAQEAIADHKARILAELREVKREAWALARPDLVLRALTTEAKITGAEAAQVIDVQGFNLEKWEETRQARLNAAQEAAQEAGQAEMAELSLTDLVKALTPEQRLELASALEALIRK
jgi:hypothetical protein